MYEHKQQEMQMILEEMVNRLTIHNLRAIAVFHPDSLNTIQLLANGNIEVIGLRARFELLPPHTLQTLFTHYLVSARILQVATITDGIDPDVKRLVETGMSEQDAFFSVLLTIFKPDQLSAYLNIFFDSLNNVKSTIMRT